MSKISEVQIKIIKPTDGLIGFASLLLNGEMYLSSIGIYTKLYGTGYRITFPTKKVGETDLHIFHPTTRQLQEEIEQAIKEKLFQIYGEQNAL